MGAGSYRRRSIQVAASCSGANRVCGTNDPFGRKHQMLSKQNRRGPIGVDKNENANPKRTWGPAR